MAKTTGPLFSLTASGTVGNTIVYSNWKGRPYVRRRIIPLNRALAGQVEVRNAMRCIANGIMFANHTILKTTPPGITDKANITLVTPDGQAWNGFLVAAAIGKNLDAYTAMIALWGTLSANHAAWVSAARALVPAIQPAPQMAAGNIPTTALTDGNVYFAYRYGLYMLGLAAAPGAVPPTYA